MSSLRIQGAPRPGFVLLLLVIGFGAWRHFHPPMPPSDAEWVGDAPPVRTASVPWSPERLDPFRRTKELSFDLQEAQMVEISIHDPTGAVVFRSPKSMYPAGRFDLEWNGCDDAGRVARPGVYTARWDFGAWSARRLLVIGGRQP